MASLCKDLEVLYSCKGKTRDRPPLSYFLLRHHDVIVVVVVVVVSMRFCLPSKTRMEAD